MTQRYKVTIFSNVPQTSSIGKGADLSKIEKVPEDFNTMCSWITPTDEGIWEFFLNPNFLNEFSILAGDALHLEQYNHLFGVGHMGTALAIVLAYYNRNRFKGTIISSLGEYGLIPRSANLKNTKVLPIEMRVITGSYAVDAYLHLRNFGAEVTEYVSVFYPLKPNSFIKQLRQTSIDRLKTKGMKIVSLVYE
jgi:hypothetical protein